MFLLSNYCHVLNVDLYETDEADMFLFPRKNVLSWWSVVAGLHSQTDENSADVQTRQVDRIIINKHYNRLTKQADIALMHLEQPVNFTRQ